MTHTFSLLTGVSQGGWGGTFEKVIVFHDNQTDKHTPHHNTNIIISIITIICILWMNGTTRECVDVLRGCERPLNHWRPDPSQSHTDASADHFWGGNAQKNRKNTTNLERKIFLSKPWSFNFAISLQRIVHSLLVFFPRMGCVRLRCLMSNMKILMSEVQYGRWQTQPLAVLDLEQLSGPFKLQTFHAFGFSRWFFCPAKAQRQIARNFQYFFCWDETREILFSIPES